MILMYHGLYFEQQGSSLLCLQVFENKTTKAKPEIGQIIQLNSIISPSGESVEYSFSVTTCLEYFPNHKVAWL